MRSAAERAAYSRDDSCSRSWPCSARLRSVCSRRWATALCSASSSSRRRRASAAADSAADELLAHQTQGLAGETAAQLEALALEPGVQLCRLRLALQRAQPRARLALDVERAVEVVLRALELQLGAAAALAVLAEPGGLLDQRRAIDRLRVDDRLDAALADHRVHLLAEAAVGENLDHVHEPAAGAVQPVDALAAAVDVARDRDLGELGVEVAVGVVDHDLDVGGAAAARAVAAGEDHVLHRLAAHRQRALLAKRPEHGVGDVRLAAAVGSDDHAHARAELELRAIGERLEPLQHDRLQVHVSGRPPASLSVSTPASLSSEPFERLARRLLLGLLLAACRCRRRAGAPRPRRPSRSGGRAAAPAPRRRCRSRSRPAGPAAPEARSCSRTWSRSRPRSAGRRPRRPPSPCARTRTRGSRRRSPASTASASTLSDAIGASIRCGWPAGATARMRSGTPSARATSTHERLLTVCARILVSRPAVWRLKRGNSAVETARLRTLSPRNASRS